MLKFGCKLTETFNSVYYFFDIYFSVLQAECSLTEVLK